MYDNAPPSRLPQNMLAIFVATIIACSGYFVFAARFGDPARRAEKAAAQIESYDSQLPGMIDSAVTARLRSDETIVRFGEVDPGVAETLQRLEAQVAELEAAVQVAQATAEAARTSVPNAPPSQATQQPGEALAAGDTPAAATPQQINQPIAAPAVPKLSDRRSGLVLRLTGAQATEGRVRFDFTITKETAGEGQIRFNAPRPNGRTRVIADTGATLSYGYSGVIGGSLSSIGVTARLPSGIPVAFSIALDSSVEAPFTARLLEIEGRIGENLRQSVVFELKEVAVAP